MADEAASASLELGHYGRVLRRRWRTLVVCALLGLLLAILYVLARPSTAQATSTVNINVVTAQPFTAQKNPSALIDSQTEIQMARSNAVVRAVAKAVGGGVTLTQVRNDITPVLVADSTVMRLTFHGSTVTQAIVGADAAAKSYIAYRGDLANAKLTTITAQLVKRRDLLNSQLAAANQRISKARTGSTAEVQALSDRQSINLELTNLISQINSVSGIDTSGGTVVTSARQAGAFVSPRRSSVLGIGLAAGLLLGLVAAFARDGLDRRLQDSRDVRRAGGDAVLGRLRETRATVPASAEDADAMRSICERLLASLPPHHPVVTIAEVTRSHVPTDVAVNTALAFGDNGASVDLILAQYPRQLVDRLVVHLGLQPVTPVGAVSRYQSATRPGLLVSVVGSAEDDSDAATPLKGLLGHFDADVTLVAIAPAASRSVRLAAGRFTHDAVFVVAERSTRADLLIERSDELRAVGATIVGTVVVPRRRQLTDLSNDDTSHSRLDPGQGSSGETEHETSPEQQQEQEPVTRSTGRP